MWQDAVCYVYKCRRLIDLSLIAVCFADGSGAIGDGWQAASALMLRLASSKSPRLMKTTATTLGETVGRTPLREKRQRVWLQRSVVACLAPMLTSSAFLSDKDPSNSNVFGGTCR